MNFSCVSLCSCICLVHIISPFKKTSSRFPFWLFVFCIPCIQFIANLSANSLQILVRSILPAELRWLMFSLWWTRSHLFVSFGPTEFFWHHRSTQLGATDFTTEKTACHLIPAFFLLQLHSMFLIFYQHYIRLAALLCDSRTKPICNKNPEEPFLEIDVKGEERDHIKA